MAGYHSGVYRQQGGHKLIVQSSSAGPASSGEIEIQTGGKLDLQAGSSMTCAGTLELASGGIVQMQSGSYTEYQSGAYWKVPIQTLTSTQTATNITNFGLSRITGTTTGPVFTLAAPVIGVTKFLSLTCSSSGVTHRAVINSNSTGVSFDTTGGNQVTLATSATRGLTLVALTTASWRICGVYTGASIAGQKTT